MMQQKSFDPDKYGGAKKALQARNKVMKEYKQDGYKVRGWSLSGQQRGYSGFGSDRDTSVRTVYMLDIYSK